MDSQHAETVVVAALLAMDKKPQVSANPRLIARTAVKALAEAGALIDGSKHPAILLLHYDGSTCQNPTCGWGHRPELIDGHDGA